MEKVLLTGASSGIGKAIALKLSNAGYKLICTVRKEEDKITLENLSENIECVYLDVTKENEVKDLYNKLKSEDVELIGIINNAGYAVAGILEDGNIEKIKQQIEVNSFAPFRIATTMLPLMKKGKIINMSSVSSNFVYPFITPYCASKRLLDTLFQGLTLELPNKNIKIVSIKPSIIKTPLWEKSFKIAEDNFNECSEEIKQKYQPMIDKFLTYIKAQVPKGLEAETVANVVLKAMKSKNPKWSYNVGIGAQLGMFLGKLPTNIKAKIFQKELTR